MGFWSFGFKCDDEAKKTLELIENQSKKQNFHCQKEIKLVLEFMVKELMEEKKEANHEQKSPLISFPYLWTEFI